MTALWTPEPGGPYTVDEASYHADKTALSSSGARTLTTSCPARFKWEQENDRPDTPDLEFGRAWHSLLLGGPPVVEITAKTRGTKAEEDARARGEIPLITKDYDTALAMIEALHQHDEAGPLFARPGRTEQTYVARDPETGVLCKIRIDFEPDVAGGRVLIVDGKTAKSVKPREFAKSMADYGYHQQGAFYRAVRRWLGLDIPPAFVLVAQEKKPPYLVLVASPDEEAMAWGDELNRRALHLYRRCTELNQWPGYDAPPEDQGVHRLALPGWQIAQYEAAAYTHDPIGETA